MGLLEKTALRTPKWVDPVALLQLVFVDITTRVEALRHLGCRNPWPYRKVCSSKHIKAPPASAPASSSSFRSSSFRSFGKWMAYLRGGDGEGGLGGWGGGWEGGKCAALATGISMRRLVLPFCHSSSMKLKLVAQFREQPGSEAGWVQRLRAFLKQKLTSPNAI